MNFKELLHIEKPLDEFDSLQRQRDIYKIGAFASGILGCSSVYLGIEADRWTPPIYFGGAILFVGLTFAVGNREFKIDQDKWVKNSVELITGSSDENNSL